MPDPRLIHHYSSDLDPVRQICPVSNSPEELIVYDGLDNCNVQRGFHPPSRLGRDRPLIRRQVHPEISPSLRSREIGETLKARIGGGVNYGVVVLLFNQVDLDPGEIAKRGR